MESKKVKCKVRRATGRRPYIYVYVYICVYAFCVEKLGTQEVQLEILISMVTKLRGPEIS